MFFSVASWVCGLTASSTQMWLKLAEQLNHLHLGQNWMKDEDAYSASLYYIVRNYDPKQLLPWNYSRIAHFILHLHVHNNYGGKSYTTYWFLVSLCNWGYWTVAELFVLDNYLYLHSYNWNQYTNIKQLNWHYAFTNVIVIQNHTWFSSSLSFYCPFIMLIVPYSSFHRAKVPFWRSVHRTKFALLRWHPALLKTWAEHCAQCLLLCEFWLRFQGNRRLDKHVLCNSIMPYRYDFLVSFYINIDHK